MLLCIKYLLESIWIFILLYYFENLKLLLLRENITND